jgi:hypothetical protein
MDPRRVVDGGGELTATLSGPGGGTQTVDLTPTQRATLAPASVNAFGLSVSYPSISSSEFANIFIDDVTYTVAVPEAGSITIWGVFIAVGIIAVRFGKRLGV